MQNKLEEWIYKDSENLASDDIVKLVTMTVAIEMIMNGHLMDLINIASKPISACSTSLFIAITISIIDVGPFHLLRHF